MPHPFSSEIRPNWEGFLRCLRREGTPDRVYFIELFLDDEVKAELVRRYDLMAGVEPADPFYLLKRDVRVQRFLGYDYVRCGLNDFDIAIARQRTSDTAELARSIGRGFVDEHRGPITTAEEFAAYPWPDPKDATTRNLEWFQENLPDDMCVIGSGGFAHFAEYLTWLMGYETLCYAVFDNQELVTAISRRLLEIYDVCVRRILQFDRVKVIWGSDDLGFRSGPLMRPADLREYVLPGHRAMAAASHAAGRPYLLHSCGRLDTIMDDLVDDVRIDGLHSYEDTIHTVEETKRRYGDRIAVLGGIDMDFLCRQDAAAVRARTRRTLDACQGGGGYCLGSGNSIANYVPLDNYLAMLDEGRRFSA